jgi:hypothetical protein
LPVATTVWAQAVKDEDCPGGGPGKFAPSEVLRKLSTSNKKKGGRNTSSFEDALKAKTREHIKSTSLFYNFPVRSPGDDSMPTGRTLTPETTLGEVRGKVVLLRRFESGQDVGLDLTYWPDNQTFRSATPPIYDVHDRYQGLTDEDKYELIITHLEEARRGDPKDLYITFSSAADLKTRGYAETINPRLSNYLASSSKNRIGTIVMDYFEESRELVSNVIKMSWRIKWTRYIGVKADGVRVVREPSLSTMHRGVDTDNADLRLMRVEVTLQRWEGGSAAATPPPESSTSTGGHMPYGHG